MYYSYSGLIDVTSHNDDTQVIDDSRNNITKEEEC